MIDTLSCPHYNLVGGLEHFFMTFRSVGNVIIPTDEVHHFSEGLVAQPPTSYVISVISIYNPII